MGEIERGRYINYVHLLELLVKKIKAGPKENIIRITNTIKEQHLPIPDLWEGLNRWTEMPNPA